ncbi:hypothetical protein [Desulfotalea psychrophila]|uniref:Bacterial mobilisation domain-containing protein n=1 Tax=Desulfotalea psychrophila (strain LSv54 / DSM 12343) TaxID=177439 RepID=Q6AI72_DESPS|nr:hypothetical protein [Desulfotalea psychrophila]CAG37857.1 hypothetical protein DPPA10 [Desulfotalea psychrophila LSv54]
MSRKKYLQEYQKEYRKEKKQVTLTLTLTEYNYFKTIADKEDIKVTSLIKAMALSQLGKTFYFPKEILKRIDEFIFIIRNIANNLNQIARHSNIIKNVINENSVLSLIKNLETEVKRFIKSKI